MDGKICKDDALQLQTRCSVVNRYARLVATREIDVHGVASSATPFDHLGVKPRTGADLEGKAARRNIPDFCF
jgi:hypothetical protein